MIKYICDRCEREIANKFIAERGTKYFHGIERHLCSSCQKAYKEFWEGKRLIDEPENGYPIATERIVAK